MLPRNQRLTSAEFDRAFRLGMAVRHPLAQVRVLRRDDGDSTTRAAFAVPKKQGKATRRNRARRRLRECYRLHPGKEQAGLAGCDLIFFATAETHGASTEQLTAALTELLRRAARKANAPAENEGGFGGKPGGERGAGHGGKENPRRGKGEGKPGTPVKAESKTATREFAPAARAQGKEVCVCASADSAPASVPAVESATQGGEGTPVHLSPVTGGWAAHEAVQEPVAPAVDAPNGPTPEGIPSVNQTGEAAPEPLPGAFTPAGVALGLIRFYQRFVSPGLPPSCRYHPTCSRYTYAAIVRFGLLRGALLGVCRVCRCHPWHPGGWDPVPRQWSLRHCFRPQSAPERIFTVDDRQ